MTWTLVVTNLLLTLSDVGKEPNGEVYSSPTATAGLRNITGKVNSDGTVSIYGVTSTADWLTHI